MSAGRLPRRGKIEQHPVTALLQAVYDGGHSGCLKVSRGRVTRTLYFKKGMITYASSTERHDRLGEVLVAQEILTREEVNEAFRKARSSQSLLGRELLVGGNITAQELFLAVTAQMVNILEKMRSWRKGDFEFDEDGAPEAGTVLLRIPLSLYLRGRQKKTGKRPRDAGRPTEPEEAAEAAGGEEVLVIDDEELEYRGEAAEEAGEEEARPAAGASLDESVIPEEEESEEEQEKLRQEVTFAVQELKLRRDGDPFTLLGVKPSSSLEEIRSAYDYLARLLHPHQHPGGLAAETASEATELFRAVASAYEEARGAAGTAGEAAPPAAPAVIERMSVSAAALDEGDVVRRLFFRAKQYMAKGNYWQAADSLRNVVRRKPQDPMYRNLLGVCLMQTGRRLHEAEEHVKEAIRLDPGNPDYITSLGLVYKAGRFHSKARDMFRQALLYDGKHRQAREELRKLGAEVETARKTGAFWSKIFRK